MELNQDALKLKRKLEKIKKKRLNDEKNVDSVGISMGPKQNEQAAQSTPSVSKEEILSEYFQFL